MPWELHRRKKGKENKQDRERGKTAWDRCNDETMEGNIKLLHLARKKNLGWKVKISEYDEMKKKWITEPWLNKTNRRL